MEFTFEQFLNTIIKKHYKFIILVTLICLTAGILLTFVLPKRYKSTGAFYIVSSSSNLGVGSDGSLLQGLSGLISTQSNKIYVENIIETRFVKDVVLEKTGLLERKKFKKRLFAYDWLTEHISVNPLRDGMIIISGYDEKPEYARELVFTYLSVIDSFYKESEIFFARNYRKFLEGREKELYASMQTSMQKMRDYQKKEKILFPELEYEAIYTSVIVPIKQELASKLIEKEKALKIYNNKSESEIANEDINITSLILDNMYNDKNALMNSSLASLPDKLREYFFLKLESDISMELYSMIKSELEKSILNEKNNVPSIYIIDHADLPEMPYFPRKRDGAIVGIFLGFMFSMIYLMIKENAGKVNEKNNRNT